MQATQHSATSKWNMWDVWKTITADIRRTIQSLQLPAKDRQNGRGQGGKVCLQQRHAIGKTCHLAVKAWGSARGIIYGICKWWWCFCAVKEMHCINQDVVSDNCVSNDAGDLALTDDFECSSDELLGMSPTAGDLPVCPWPLTIKHSARWNAAKLLTHHSWDTERWWWGRDLSWQLR